MTTPDHASSPLGVDSRGPRSDPDDIKARRLGPHATVLVNDDGQPIIRTDGFPIREPGDQSAFSPVAAPTPLDAFTLGDLTDLATLLTKIIDMRLAAYRQMGHITNDDLEPIVAAERQLLADVHARITAWTDPPIPQRHELIALCTRGVVDHANWSNRDTYAAQCQLGKCRALLAAGCEYTVYLNQRGNTWRVTTLARGFDSFEYGDHDEDHRIDESFYVPTAARLAATVGQDWYC